MSGLVALQRRDGGRGCLELQGGAEWSELATSFPPCLPLPYRPSASRTGLPSVLASISAFGRSGMPRVWSGARSCPSDRPELIVHSSSLFLLLLSLAGSPTPTESTPKISTSGPRGNRRETWREAKGYVLAFQLAFPPPALQLPHPTTRRRLVNHNDLLTLDPHVSLLNRRMKPRVTNNGMNAQGKLIGKRKAGRPGRRR